MKAEKESKSLESSWNEINVRYCLASHRLLVSMEQKKITGSNRSV